MWAEARGRGEPFAMASALQGGAEGRLDFLVPQRVHRQLCRCWLGLRGARLAPQGGCVRRPSESSTPPPASDSQASDPLVKGARERFLLGYLAYAAAGIRPEAEGYVPRGRPCSAASELQCPGGGVCVGAQTQDRQAWGVLRVRAALQAGLRFSLGCASGWAALHGLGSGIERPCCMSGLLACRVGSLAMSP